jgi:hypothetical protein
MRNKRPVDGRENARENWEAPTVTKLPIADQTKTSGSAGALPTSRSGRGQPGSNPPPAAAPASKFGFSFEWSFPLSTRTDEENRD